jgi:capsular polysaccharide biosynthesis protein
VSRDRPTLLAALRRHPGLVIVSGVAAGLLGAGVGLSLPLSYAATAHVVVSLPDEVSGSEEVEGASSEEPEEAAQRAAQAMVGEAVTRSAGERVPGRPSPQDVAAALTVVPSADSGVVSVTATGSTPAGARALANAVAESYLELSAAETAEDYARRIERLDAERQGLQAQLASVWEAFGIRAANLRAVAGPISTVSAVVGADPVLDQLRDDGGRLAERLSTVERSIVAAEANTALAPIQGQELVRADEPPSARDAMVRRSAGLAVPLGVLLGAGLAWRRSETGGTTSGPRGAGVRLLGRLPAGRGRDIDTANLGLWRQLRLVGTARQLDDLVFLELPSPRRWRRAAQPLLEAARADGCIVRYDVADPGGRHGAAVNGSRRPGAGPLRVIRATSTAVLSRVPVPRRTGVVVVGPQSASFDRDVRSVQDLVAAAGGDFLGVLVVGAAPRGRGLPRGAEPVRMSGRRSTVPTSEER